MMKRKEFMLGAIAGLTFAAAATAGGVIDWPTANAGPVAGFTGRLSPDNGGAGLAFAPPQGAPLSFADIFAQVAPAVVQIEVRTRVAQAGRDVAAERDAGHRLDTARDADVDGDAVLLVG